MYVSVYQSIHFSVVAQVPSLVALASALLDAPPPSASAAVLVTAPDGLSASEVDIYQIYKARARVGPNPNPLP